MIELALLQAKKAFEKDEVPVGAVVVDNLSGKIVAKAYNLSEHGGNATYHAEILAINKACKKLKTNRLRNCDLYVTLEPCTMCAGAISLARIQNLYIGATDEKGGAIINGVKFFSNPTCHHKPNVILLNNALCAQILKDFFKLKRRKATSLA